MVTTNIQIQFLITFLVENQLSQVSLIFFEFNFSFEVFEFCFNLRCKIEWPPGQLDRVYEKVSDEPEILISIIHRTIEKIRKRGDLKIIIISKLNTQQLLDSLYYLK